FTEIFGTVILWIKEKLQVHAHLKESLAVRLAWAAYPFGRSTVMSWLHLLYAAQITAVAKTSPHKLAACAPKFNSKNNLLDRVRNVYFGQRLETSLTCPTV